MIADLTAASPCKREEERRTEKENFKIK